MFGVFIVLWDFSKSLARDLRKCLFLNDELCLVRPTLINMNPNELKYYPYNVISPKIWLPKDTKYIYVKAFSMIIDNIEAKAMTENISCDCKCKFNSTEFNSNQKWNNKTCHCECKNYRTCKNNYNWNPSTCICENGI